MRIVTLKPEQFDNFAKNHRYRNYLQTSAYGNVMLKQGFNIHYLGVVNSDNKLIGATLIIYKEAILKYKIAYCPRGILFDYESADDVSEMTESLKRLLSKQGFMLLTMDPYIPIAIKSNTGDLININSKETDIINNIVNAGFKYKGKNLYFENHFSRWESLVLLNKDPKLLFEDFDKRTRTKIRHADNSGIKIVKDEKNDITELYKLIKNKDNKPLRFYQQLIESFKDQVEVYYAKIDTEVFVVNSRQLYEQEMLNNDQLTQQITLQRNAKDKNQIISKKMESDRLINQYKQNLLTATELLKSNPKGIIIGGCLNIIYDNAAFMYTEGFDEKYSNLSCNYLLKWELIEEYTRRNYKYLNLNAVVGSTENKQYSGLNETKLGFHSIITEYIGEFEIVLNNFAYNLYKKLNKK